MKRKKAATKRTSIVKAKPDGLSGLLGEVRRLILSARQAAATTVNTLQVRTQF